MQDQVVPGSFGENWLGFLKSAERVLRADRRSGKARFFNGYSDHALNIADELKTGPCLRRMQDAWQATLPEGKETIGHELLEEELVIYRESVERYLGPESEEHASGFKAAGGKRRVPALKRVVGVAKTLLDSLLDALGAGLDVSTRLLCEGFREMLEILSGQST